MCRFIVMGEIKLQKGRVLFRVTMIKRNFHGSSIVQDGLQTCVKSTRLGIIFPHNGPGEIV